MFKKVLLRTTCLLLIIVLGFTASVQARSVPGIGFGTEQGQSGQTVTIRSTRAQRQAMLEMWTLEARAAAEPLPWPAVSPDQLDQLLKEASPGATESLGAAGFAAGGVPNPRAVKLARRQFPEAWEEIDEVLAEELFADAMAAGEESSTPFGTWGVYTTWMGNKWGQFWLKYPFRAIGKLYFNVPGGSSTCSASVISPNNIIVTAAHCVFDTDNDVWYSGWSFVPADRKGVAPFGSFPWASATVLGNWIAAPDSLTGRRYDVALIQLGNNAVGNPVTWYTGWLGRSWDWGYTQHHLAVGYPINLSGAGRWTHICAAESFQQATDVLGMGCDMMWGSSGGPWIWQFEYILGGAANYVNSVVSGGLPGPTWGNTFYGPRFSSNNIVILCGVVGC